MISSTGVEVKVTAWNTGEEPVEFPQGQDDNAIQYWVAEQLATHEFAKFVRTFPSNAHVEGGEIVLLYQAFTDEFRGRQMISGTDEQDLAESVERHKKFCAQKVFTPAELYALKPALRRHDGEPLVDFGGWHTVTVHLQEVDYYDLDTDKIEATRRFEVRTLVDHDYDGRRTWTLETVWFDSKPVMVVNSSGRDGDEYHERWITDGAAFGDLIVFLNSFRKTDEQSGDFVKASDVIPAMTEFYNHTIHDYYDVERQESRKS
jgi:hypothetical protein